MTVVEPHSQRPAVSEPGVSTSPLGLDALGRKIAASWLQLFSGSMVSSLLNFLSFVLLSRSISVELVGIIAIVQTYWRLMEGILSFHSFTVLISYGPTALISGDKRDFLQIVRICVSADVLMAILGGIIGVSGLLLFAPSLNIPSDFEGLSIAGVLMMLHMVTGAPSGVLRIFDRFYLVAVADVLVGAIRLIGTMIGFLASLPAAYFLSAWIVAQFAGDLFVIVVGYLALKKEGFGGWLRQPAAEHGRKRILVRSLLVNNFSSMINITSEEGDVMLVNALLGASGTGKYRIAKNFAGIIHRLSGPLHNVIYPEISRLIAAQNRELLSKLCWGINLGSGLIALIALAGWALFGETILRYSVGSDYVDTHSAILILMSAIAVAFFGLCCSPTLRSLRLWREIFAISLISTAAFFTTAALLIPHYGINGAAAGYFVCYSVEIGLSLAAIRRALRARSWST